MPEISDDYRDICENGCWTCKHMRVQTYYDSDDDAVLMCCYNPPITPGFPWVSPEWSCSQHTRNDGTQILVGPKAGYRPQPPIERHLE